MYDIRNISNYFKEVHSRYWIDINCVVYTSLAVNNYRIMINGARINYRNWVRQNIVTLNQCSNPIIPIPDTNNEYYLLYNGLVLKRVSTRCSRDNSYRVDVALIRVYGGNDRNNRYAVHRLMAGCFLGDVKGMDIHHIDENPKNNKLENLQIVSREEHIEIHRL